jgi:glucosamine 6-phosphate synthetase-like amidotransferase/phosphosugar isomerase protein
MCGIVGYSCENPKQNHIQILQDIIAESSIRGIHSFGYSFVKDKKLITRKYHDLKEVKLPLTNKIIYHNRYSTSGDFKNHKNNQPIHIDNMSLVFNGVIDMRTKKQMENAYNIFMETDNDGEILIQRCGNDKKLIERFVNDIRGSFAGIILDEKENLFVIRNKKRPCWILEYDNAKFVASTRDIFKRVDNTFMPKPLEANKIYEI